MINWEERRDKRFILDVFNKKFTLLKNVIASCFYFLAWAHSI
jgi:hypothetical protein